ncbi:MAG TPA: HAD hydrolase-like protein [Lentimicrobium sp.]|nr:HAD hydrolase-like protein [Lentimicrobium sp.]
MNRINARASFIKHWYKTIMKHIRNIIWDFNGTLLDDLDLCLEIINVLLERRGIKPLSRERYLEIFTFPVRDYYLAAGMNFRSEPFEAVAKEYMDIYLSRVCSIPLHAGTAGILNRFRENGFEQIILSAMEQEELLRVVHCNGIEEYFRQIFGISNHLGGGKLELTQTVMQVTGFDPATTCLIGDTLHDMEVARKAGIRCILIANGHQSEKRLAETGLPVAGDIRELPSLFGL